MGGRGSATKRGSNWGGALAFVLLLVSAEQAAAQPLVLPLEAWSSSQATILSGQRIERDSRGRLVVAEEIFPPGGEPHGQRLPEHLGGGVLFFQAVQSSSDTQTALWRGPTWTGSLEPLGRLSFAVERALPGFDRLYLGSRGEWLGFDLGTRRVTGLGPVPNVPSLDVLAFAGGGTAAVQAPLRGVLWTRDAGLSWQPLDDALALEAESGIVIQTSSGRVRLLEEGRRVPLQVAPVAAENRGKGDADKLAWALLSGVEYQGAVWAVRGQELLEVRRADGLSIRSHRLPSALGVCRGVAREPRPWFVCASDETRVLELQTSTRPEGAALGERSRLSGARRLLATGPGGVLLDGACQAGAAGAKPAQCWVAVDSTQTLTGSPGLAFGVGQREIVVLEREAHGFVLKSRGARRAKKFALPQEGELSRLLSEGHWLRELVETKDGWVGWVTRGEEFVGVALADGGQVSAGPIQRYLRRAILARERGLLWGAAGFAKETIDGGMTWRELSLPFRSGDPDLSVPESLSADLKMGCSPAGCLLGRLFRLGWGGAAGAPSKVLAYPEFVPRPPPGAGRFRFSCSSERETAAPKAQGFFGVTPSVAQLPGFATPSVDALEEMGRLFAAGPRDVSWTRAGQAQILFRDPFSSSKALMTLPTQGLFADALRADEALGRLEPGSSTAAITLTARGDGGFFLISGRSRVDLFTFAAGEPIERVEGAFELGVRRLHGAVRVGGDWYTSYRTRDLLTLLRVEAGRLVEVRSFPLGGAASGQVDVVASDSEQLALAIDGDAGLYVYALRESGDLGEPIFAPHQGASPHACAADTPGYSVVRELALSPQIEQAGAMLDVSRVAARFRMGPGWICVDALSARNRGALSRVSGEPSGTPLPRSTPAPRRGLGIPLTVTDFSGQGGLAQLRCD